MTAAFDINWDNAGSQRFAGRARTGPHSRPASKPERDAGADPIDQLDQFDETDGAYATAEPDPFADHAEDSREHGGSTGFAALPHRKPSLRVELGTHPAGSAAGLVRPALPPLPVAPGLRSILPHGLRRGSTIAITSSVSLLFALLGAASATGTWTAMVGMPTISAEAAAEAGMSLDRLAIVKAPESDWTPASWATAVGALLDAVDVVVARPGVTNSTLRQSGISDSDARRLTARARNKDAVLILFGQYAASWPATELQLSAQHTHWTGIGDGYGRIKARQLIVSASGKGRSSQSRKAELWLPIEHSTSDPDLRTAAALATQTLQQTG